MNSRLVIAIIEYIFAAASAAFGVVGLTAYIFSGTDAFGITTGATFEPLWAFLLYGSAIFYAFVFFQFAREMEKRSKKEI